MPEIQATIHHRHRAELPRSKDEGELIAGGGEFTLAGSAPHPNVIVCHNCTKRGTKRAVAAAPAKNHKQSNKHTKKNSETVGNVVDTMDERCSLHNTTSHNDIDCYLQPGSAAPGLGRCVFRWCLKHQLTSCWQRQETVAINVDEGSLVRVR